MAESAQQVIWETWHRQANDEVVPRPALEKFARLLHADPKQTIDQLVRRRLIVPLFRGFYYVRTPQEVALGQPKYDALQLFSLGARWADVEECYFGLETALHIHGLSQEFRRVEYVISNRVQRTNPIEIEDRGFQILRWTAAPVKRESGIGRFRGMRVSTPPRTAVDFLYQDYWATQRGNEALGRWRDLLARVNLKDAHNYLLKFKDVRFHEWARPRLGV